MSLVYPERITQVRELMGLSKTELAVLLGVKPQAVAQWESKTRNPTAENMGELARKLDIPMALLLRPMPSEILRMGPITFRAWGSAKTRKANRKAASVAELVAEIYLWIASRVSFPDATLPEVEVENVEDAATQCRRAWGLGDRPIIQLGELLESKGIILASASFEDDRFDAFSCIINGRPFVFLGAEKRDNARTHFDSAHELGHLVLHQHLTDLDLRVPETHNRIEAEANAFAGAFLLPAETFRNDMLDVSLDGFLKLKSKWGVSVQAMIMRARDLEVIDDGYARELLRQVGVKGWRRAQAEPLDDLVVPVAATVGKRSLELLTDVIEPWQLPAELPMPADILANVFQANPEQFKPSELRKVISIREFVAAEKQSVVAQTDMFA